MDETAFPILLADAMRRLDALDGITLDADDMNSDLHASAEFRAHLCVVMAKRAVQALV